MSVESKRSNNFRKTSEGNIFESINAHENICPEYCYLDIAKMKNVIRKKEKNIANGVFIFGKFITQSLDEPERQIIHFFRLQLSRRRSMPTSKRVHTIFCQTYITFYEPFHYGIFT